LQNCQRAINAVIGGLDRWRPIARATLRRAISQFFNAEAPGHGAKNS